MDTAHPSFGYQYVDWHPSQVILEVPTREKMFRKVHRVSPICRNVNADNTNNTSNTFNKECTIQQFVIIQKARQMKRLMNMAWTKACGANTLSDLVILVRSTCSPMSLLCLVSRNDRSWMWLPHPFFPFKSSSCFSQGCHINKWVLKCSTNLECHSNYSHPNVTTLIHPCEDVAEEIREKNHRNTLIGTQVTPPSQTYRDFEP